MNKWCVVMTTLYYTDEDLQYYQEAKHNARVQITEEKKKVSRK